MATRNIVPRSDTEGGIGTAIKRWGLGWINALVVNSIKIVTGASASKVLTSDADGNATWQSPAAGATFASAAESLASIEPAKALAPNTSREMITNLKPVVNASVNKLDIFSKSGGAAFDSSNPFKCMIPDGNGYTQRTRAAAVASGTGQIVLADAANYWSKGSLDAEIKTAYIYAIWSTADGGIVFALAGYSGFTRVPATGGASTDDDWFLLEGGSTYTQVITDYCVCIGKIRYQYDTADTPDHTIQATVLDAPQVIWNPKSDYGYQKNLATTVTSGSAITEYSAISVMVKQSGKYFITGKAKGSNSAAIFYIYSYIKTGSATYGSAIQLVTGAQENSLATGGDGATAPVSGEIYLNAGDTIHLGAAVDGGGTRRLFGDNTSVGSTTMNFMRID